jgi:pSer/pThr/pTyr-binding forkhead associated (FHA) protein
MNTPLPAFLVLVDFPPPPLMPAPIGGTGPWTGQPFPLLPGDNIIGRDAGPDVTVSLPWWYHVSRRHTLIAWDGLGAWEIEDLRSRNGTELNGQPMQPHARQTLRDGDRVRVANIEFLFAFQIAPPSAPARSSDQVTQDIRMTS